MPTKAELEQLVAETPLEDLPAYHAVRLKRFVEQARNSVSFYGNRFERLIHGGSSFLERWREIPILSKAEFREAPEKLFSLNVPWEAGTIQSGWTSGATGSPLNFRRTQYAEHVNLAMNLRMFRLWEMDGQKTMAVLKRAGQEGEKSIRRGKGWNPLDGDGDCHIITGQTLSKQLDIICTIKPAYLKSYPAIFVELAEIVRERREQIKFDLLLSGATILEDWQRQLCQVVFGARIVDIYGTAETGLIGYECPKCGEYHICFENVYTELVKENGEPAAPGELGKIIVTPFQNDAMPLVRYDTGDYAERGLAGEPCSDQPFTFRRVIGRSKSLFMRPDGSKFWPRVSHEIAASAGIRKYRVVQVDRKKIEFFYLPRPNQIVDENMMKDDLRNHIGKEFEYIFIIMNHEDNLHNPKMMTFESLIN